MVTPNFLIIGAQKSGTTALYHYLDQHPDVYMSPLKEPNFFAFENQVLDYRDVDGGPAPINTRSVTTLDAYRALFEGWEGQQAVGEASPHYLCVPQAAARIKHYVPNARLIAILRNPVDRAYSAFLHAVRADREPVRYFSEALRLEEGRIRNNCGFLYRYQHLGFYYEQLKRYFDTFDPAQIKVYLYDDLKADLPGTIADLFRFLDVDPSFQPDTSTRHNQSGIPQNSAIHTATLAVISGKGPVRSLLADHLPASLKAMLPMQWVLRTAMKLRDRNLYKPPLPPDVRDTLKTVFLEDILKLQDLIARDLSHWLQSPLPNEKKHPERTNMTSFPE